MFTRWVLGVTGSIASGKSLVANCMVEMGAALVSADSIAREVVQPGEGTLAELVALFGDDILNSAGELDRGRLAGIVFRDPDKRRQLNAIMHPAIARISEQRLRDLRRSKVPLIVYEAPLLFEAGAENRVDRILTVFIDPESQLDRLCARDAISREAARARVEAQWRQHEKISRSDYVIDNSGSIEETCRAVRALFHYLTSTL
ncbi:MAG TPA: dephospho-CoA kinase [Desulfuromonadales bacterium]|nr:dephospho-CoA kinase [Desulfuromonadales bacterium]